MGRGIEVWDLKTEQKTCSLPLPDGFNLGLSVISPNGQFLAAPGNSLLVIQELREDARPTILALPEAKGPFGLGCKSLAFSHDGSELAGAFEDGFGPWRLVSWDIKKGAVAIDHSVEVGKSVRGAFFYQNGPVMEWLPEKKGWMLYGQVVIEYRTGKVEGTLPIETELQPQLLRVLTSEYAVECTGSEIKIVSMPKGK